MNIEDVAKNRYSCRKYKSDAIDETMLTKVLNTFRIAPSAVNFQPWHLIIIKSEMNKAKVYEAYPREWIKTAPMFIIACGDKTVSWKRGDGKDYLDVDIAIAVDHMMLQATELGLATCWVCNFNASVLKQNFNIPGNIEPVAIIPIGYPADSGDPNRYDTKRKSLKEFVHWETFENKK
ncbi:MAG TPA: nitroreductase family protein [Bacteroidales bacterium]